MRVKLERGDITKQKVDAIVNAANERMLGGGGVDGAIHRAAGSDLLEACKKIPEVRPGVRCPTGEARITPGFDLPATYVIHTVGPVYKNHPEDVEFLASAYRSSLLLAEEYGIRTIAFPAISCGVYGYPMKDASCVALRVFHECSWDLDEIRVVLFSSEALQTWQHCRTLFFNL